VEFCNAISDATRKELLLGLGVSGAEQQPPPKKKAKFQSKIGTGALLKQSAAEKATSDEKFAQFLVAHDLPFSLGSSPELAEFIRSIGSSYKPPKRTALATTHLDSLHTKTKARVDEVLAATDLVQTSSDAWSNTRSEPIVAHMVCTADADYFLDASDASEVNFSNFVGCFSYPIPGR